MFGLRASFKRMVMIAEGTRTRWGKLRPYILFSLVPIALFTVLNYLAPDFGSPTARLVWCYVMYIGWGMSYTMCDIPYWGLSAAMTNDTKERTSLLTMAGSAHLALPDEEELGLRRRDRGELVRLALAGKDALELDLPVEIVLERFLASGTDDDDLRNSGFHELVYDIGDGRLRTDREKLLGHRLRDGKEARAVSCGDDYAFHRAMLPRREVSFKTRAGGWWHCKKLIAAHTVCLSLKSKLDFK